MTDRKDTGASAKADQALAVPVEPASGLAPLGFDPSRGAEAFHPSEYIADELKARGWDKFDLAARMGGDPARNILMLDVYFIVGPERSNCRIGDVMAHQLAVAFDVSAQFFLNLEAAWLAHAVRDNADAQGNSHD